jgi:ATP phosphoribosyltransferase regulatory subunit
MSRGWSLDRQVPIGFTDLFFDEAARQLWLSQTLRDRFARWGYTPIIPPSVAYAEELAPERASAVYRFFDRNGHTLSLRADLTLPVARIVGTRLYDQPLPLRLCYVERVFRHVPPQAGQRREFTQAGVELVGADTPQADAEVIALAADALDAIGIEHYRLALGQMAFFRALLGELDLAPADIDRLKEAIDRRNDRHLQSVLADLALPNTMQTLLRALPTLTGDREVIQQARQLTSAPAAHRALDRLIEVLDLLDAYGLSQVVLVDLGEVRGMDYYTGLVFQAYAARVGSALCSGGRYDDLISRFGHDLPAIGFGIDVGLARLAVEPAVRLAPDVIVQSCTHKACYQIVQAMRAKGLRVVVDTSERSDQEFAHYTRSLDTRVAHCLGPGTWRITTREGTSHTVDGLQILEEVDTW